VSKPLHESEAARIGRGIQPRWEPTDTHRALAATHARLVQRKQRFTLGTAALAVALAAAALGLVVYQLRSRAPLPEGSAVAAAVVASALPPANDPSVTRFSDGSTARVLGAGQVVVRTATDALIETTLDSGAAEYSVAPRSGRRFVVHAGIATVEVIGTQFRVEHEGERVRVSVTRGKVKVSAGEERITLVPGESRWFSPASGVLPEPSDAAAPHAAAGSPRDRFVDLAHRGDYRGAYQVLARSPGAVGAGPEDLMLAADAARLSNHPEEALPYLRRVTRDYPRDSRAALSAFTQGRILLSQLGRPAEAAEAFAQSRRLAPSGALAEPALGREIEALNRAGQSDRAALLAGEYARRYPNGKQVISPEESRRSP
jgi:transmembrane sensor